MQNTLPDIHLAENNAPAPRTAQTPPEPKVSQLEEYFNKLDEELEKRHEAAWRADYKLWLRTLLTYTGKFLLQERQFGFGFDVIPVQANDRIYIQNKLRFYSDDVVNQWVASDPKIDVLAMADADDKRRRATRAARGINDHYNRLHFTEQFKQITAKLAQFCGNYHAEVYFDPQAEGKAKQPILQEVALPGAAAWTCGECGMGGEGEVMTCLHCGSEMVQNDVAPPATTQQVVGHKVVHAGDIRCEPIPAWQLRYERGDLPEKSEWMRRSRDFPLETVQALFPDKKITPTQSDESTASPDRVLRKASSAANASVSVYGNGQDDSFYVEFLEFWYEPALYYNVVLKDAEILADGTELPAGTRLVDVFPNGMYRARVRGGKETLLMRPESHKKRIVSAQFIMVPGRGVGDNIQDALEYQKQDTVLNSVNFQAYMKAATPTLVVNDRLISESGLNTKPGGVITVSGRKLRERETVQSAFGVVPATPPAPAMQQYLFAVEGGLQKALKSLTLDSGLSGFKSDTAYGDRIAEAKTQLARTSELALLGDWYKRICGLRMEIAQQYLTDERIIQCSGTGGQLEALEFKAADIDCDFLFWVAGTSYMPQSPMLKQANLQGAIEAVTMLKAAQLYTPASQQLVNAIFDVELTGENGALYQDWVRKVITDMQIALPQATMMAQQMAMQPMAQVDPMTGMVVPVDPLRMAGEALASAVNVDPYELGAEQKIHGLRQWLSEPEGQEADLIHREGVHVVIDQLLEGMAEEAARTAMLQTVGQPMPMAGPDSGPPSSGKSSQQKDREKTNKQVSNTPAKPPRQASAAPSGI